MMIKEELLKLSKKLGIKDKQLFDNLYKETIETAQKMLGSINQNSYQHLEYIKDIFEDLSMNIKETTVMEKKDLLKEYLYGDKSVDELLNEYETSADVKAKTDKTILPKKKKVNEEDEAESVEESKIREGVDYVDRIVIYLSGSGYFGSDIVGSVIEAIYNTNTYDPYLYGDDAKNSLLDAYDYLQSDEERNI